MTDFNHLIETHVEGKRLGRHVEHDPLSNNFPFMVEEAMPLQKVLWPRYTAIFNQGELGSCTGNACAGAVDTKPLHKTGRNLHEKDAVALYEMATTLDSQPGSYPPNDTGSSGLAVAKAAQKKGYISSYQHAFSLDQALQALMHGPVITGVSWFEGFDSPDESGLVEIDGQVRGGHEFLIRGYDPATDLVSADNSWGKSYGVHGSFFFTSKTWAELLAQQGDVTILLP